MLRLGLRGSLSLCGGLSLCNGLGLCSGLSLCDLGCLGMLRVRGGDDVMVLSIGSLLHLLCLLRAQELRILPGAGARQRRLWPATRR